MNTQVSAEPYDTGIIRAFALATVFWGIIGMAVGVLIHHATIGAASY